MSKQSSETKGIDFSSQTVSIIDWENLEASVDQNWILKQTWNITINLCYYFTVSGVPRSGKRSQAFAKDWSECL